MKKSNKQDIRRGKVSLRLTKWSDAENIDQEAYSNEKTAVYVISFIRRWKHDNGLVLNAPLSEVVLSGNANDYI